MRLEHQEVKQYLRQRYPMLLVDRVLDVNADYAIGVKNVTGSDSVLSGHFPDEPIFPGVLLIEAMCQLGGIFYFFAHSDGQPRNGYLAKVDKVKFKSMIRPGDQIMLRAERLEVFGNMARVRVSAKVEDNEVGEGEVTYYFAKTETPTETKA